MQRSSSSTRRVTPTSHRDGSLNRIIENRIFINNSSTQPNLSQKLDDIKREISKQYQKKFSTERKQSVSLRENEHSVLNSHKVKRVLAREQEERFKQQYYQLKDQYLNEKKEFVHVIEKYNSLRSVIESYFRNPLDPSYIGKLKEYYLSDNIDQYIQFVLELNRQNEELKGHIERMLKIFQLHDFQDMIREITELLDKNKQHKSRDYECDLDRLKFDLLESQKQVRDYSKLIDDQHLQMKELSLELNAKAVLLKEAEKKTFEQHRIRVEYQAELQKSIQQRDKHLIRIEDLKSQFETYSQKIKEGASQKQNLQRSIARLESVIQTQQKQNVELVRKVGSYEDEKNRLLSNMVEGEERYQHLDNRLSKMISDYESSRGEWADQIRIKDRELSQLKEQLTYEKISINRVCDLLRVVEQDEISQRIKSLLSTEVQHNAAQPALTDLTRRMEQMLSDNLQLKEQLAKTVSERNEYKFVLNNLNQDIVNLKKEESEKSKTAVDRQEQVFLQQQKKLQKEVETVESSKKAVQEQLAFHRKQNEVLLNRNDKLIKDLSVSEESQRAMSIENKKLKEQMSNILLELKEIQETNCLTANKLKISQEETTTYREKFEWIQNEMGKLIKQHQLELQKRQADMGVFKEKCELAMSNLETLKSQMVYKENDYKITVGKLNMELESKISLLNIAEESHRRRLNDADKRYQHLSSQESLLKNEIANLQHQLLLKDEECMEINRKLREQKSTSEKQQDRQKHRVEELEYEIEKRQLQSQETSNELKQLRRDKNEMSVKMLKTKSDEKILVQQLTEEEQRLQHELLMINLKIQQSNNQHDMEIEAKKIQLQTYVERIRELEHNLKQSEKMLSETQQVLSNRNTEHEDTVIELAEARAYISQMQSVITKKETDIKQLQARVAELDAEARRLGWVNAVSEVQQQKESAYQEKNMEIGKLYQASPIKISHTSPSRKAALNERSSELNSQKIDQLLATLKEKEETIEILQQRQTDLQIKNNQNAKKNRQFLSERAIQNQKLSKLQQNLKQFSARQKELKSELQKKEYQKLSALAEANQYKQQPQLIEKNLISLQDQLVTKEKEVEELKKKLDAVVENINIAGVSSSDQQELHQDTLEQLTIKLAKTEQLHKKQIQEIMQFKEKVKRLQEQLAEAHDINEHLLEEQAQTYNLLADVNNSLDEMKLNQWKRVKNILLGLSSGESNKQARESLPYWPDISDLFDEILNRATRFKHNALQISVVEAPRTTRGLPSPTPSLAKQFLFERQKTDPMTDEQDNAKIMQLTNELQELRHQNHLMEAQVADSERNEETFMMMQDQLKQQLKELQRKNSSLENNNNIQTVKTLKALFSKLLDALFDNNFSEFEEATRVILKILDYPAQYREKVQQDFEKRKKKKGFLGLFK